MHHTAQLALDELCKTLRILQPSRRNELTIRRLQRVMRLVSDLGMEAVETEAMLEQMKQYLPYPWDECA